MPYFELENPRVLAKQEQSQRGSSHAKLINLLTQEEWEFLYNPESIATEYTISTAESPTLYSTVQSRTYTHTSADRLSFSNILLTGWCAGKTVEQAIASFRKLSRLDPEKKEYPRLTLQWGSKKWESVVLDGAVSINSTLFLENGVAECRLSFSLVQVPDPIEAEKRAPVDPATQPMTLTDRQRTDARTKAGEWIQANINAIDPQIREPIRASQFSYLTSTDGSVSIVVGGKTYKIGSYNGQILDTSTNELGVR